MLPDQDGFRVLKTMKERGLDVPVLILTARGEEEDKVRGLRLGAEDYVTKPFGPRELLARVRTALRRGPAEVSGGTSERIVRGGLMIDAAAHRLMVDGKPVSLTATEMRLLHFLASNAGRVFSRDQLITNAIGGDAAVIDRNIDVHVRSIRKKLGDCRHLIGTIRGVGYRFQDQEAE